MAATRRIPALLALAIAITTPLLTSRADPAEPGWRYDTATKKLTELGVPDGQTPWILSCTSSQTGKIAITGISQVGTNTVINLDVPITTADDTHIELTGINYNSFRYNNTTIHAVALPDTVTDIGSSAFQGCSYMTTLKLPARLSTLGNGAFAYCSRLRTIENFLPATLTSIGSEAFSGCIRLASSAVLGHGLDDNQNPIALVIGGKAFYNNKAMPSATIGPGVTDIPSLMFYQCLSLKSVTLHDGIVSIGSSAFRDCAILETVSPLTPSALTSLGVDAYRNCTALTGEAVLGATGPCAIANGAFCGSGITSIRLGPGVTGAIPKEFCWKCAALSDIRMEGTLTAVNDYAFAECSALESVHLPGSVVSIGANAFSTCSALRSVSLPMALASIGNNAFSKCEALETVAPLLPAGCATIGNSAFAECKTLYGDLFFATNGSPATIGSSAFSGTHIASATLGDAVSRIEDSLFSGCPALRSCHLPADLTFVGNKAFSSCPELESVDPLMPAGCTNIGTSAFHACTKLTGDLFFATNGVAAALGDYVFYKTGITSATLGDAITAIGSYAFNSCELLRSVRLPAGLRAINSYAFQYCRALTTVSPLLPHLCTTIGHSAFMECNNLAGDLVINGGGGAVTLSQSDFNATKLTSVAFSEGVTSISPYFLANVSTLQKIVLASKPSWINTSFTGLADYSVRIVVPADDPDWATFISTPASATPWDDLAASVQQAYFDAFPGEPPPRALTKTAPANQWIVSYGTTPAGECDLVVAGLPTSAAGAQVSPAYGTYVNLAATPGLPMTLSAPPFANEPDIRYACVGYRIEEPSLAGWANAVDYGLSDPSTPSVSYMPDGDGQRRFSWLWEPVGYAVTIVPPTDASIGTVTVAGADASGYFAPGGTATVTVVPGAAAFVRWHGNIPNGHETDNPLTLVMDGPKTLIPEFASEWVYDSVAKTVTDGYWTLGVTGSRDALTVGAPKSGGVSPSGVLDLRKPIADGGAFVGIASSAFKGNKSISAVHLPNTIASLGNEAFRSCASLKILDPLLPATLISVGNYCFYECAALEGDLTFATNGASATLGTYCFTGSRISSATLGDGVAVIPIYSFSSCTSLDRVKLGEGVVSILQQAFGGCTSLTNVTPLLPASTTELGLGCFYNCPRLEGELFFATNGAPASLDRQAFQNGSRITSVVIGPGVTSLPNNAFRDCVALKRVTVGENVSSIGESCFNGCSSLTNFTPLLPAATAEIGNSCFSGCTSLSGDLYFATNGIPAKFTGADNFKGTRLESVTLGDGLTAIPANAFNSCWVLRSVHVGDKLESIGSLAFRDCPNLTVFTPFLPSGLTSVNNQAFFGPNSLTGTLTIGMDKRDVSFSGAQQFYWTAITNLVLGPRLTTMGSSQAFNSCKQLQSITINSTPVIGATAFNSCTSVREVIFSGAIPETMPASAFSGWTTGQSRLFIPKDDAAWLDWVHANVRLWDELTDDERDTYWDGWPGERKPWGMTKSTAVPASQYVMGWISPGRGTIIILQ